LRFSGKLIHCRQVQPQKNSTIENPMKKLIPLLFALGGFAVWAFAEEIAPAKKAIGGDVTVKGEVLDMACYLDHGAQGAGHAGCAEKCISSGLPVGLKTADGQVYLLIGEHKPLNDQLASYAAKTVTIHGKLVERDGIKLIENAELQM
jgi:hypothetical protein